jgi:outer membrane protein TolC
VLYNLQTPNENQFVSSFNINNYRWGLDFSMPLFLRRERGRLKSTQFQVQEIKLLEAQRKTEISNNLNFYDGLISNLNGQVAIARQIVAGSKILLDAEKTQFDAGESSVFLINSRENTLATNQIKLLEIQAKLQVANAGSHYVAGRLAE